MLICKRENTTLSFEEHTGVYTVEQDGFSWISRGRRPYVILRRRAGKKFIYAVKRFSSAAHREAGVRGNRIVASYSGFSAFGKPCSFTLVCTAEITDDGAVVFSVKAEHETEMEIEAVFFPAPFQEKKPGGEAYAVEANRQGFLMPDGYNKNWLSTFLLTVNLRKINTGDCYHPFWGRVCGTHGYTAIADTPYDASLFSCFGDRRALLSSVHWNASLGHLSYERRLIFRFSQHCDYNTIAKEYRKYLIDTGRFVSIREKIAANPNVAYLAGAPVLHHKILRNVQPQSNYYKKGKENKKLFASFAERAQQMEKIKSFGLEKLYLHTDGWGVAGYDNQHPYVLPPNAEAGGYEGMKTLCDTCSAIGYRFGVHDQYRDFYYDCAQFDKTLAVENIDGSNPYCDVWDGGAHTWLCTSKALPFVKQTYETLEAHGIHVDGSYLDVFGVVAGDECFHKEHRLTREQSVLCRKECFDYLRGKGIIASSEEGSGLMLDKLDLVHHAPYAVRPQGGGKAIGIPVPLTNLVYHDCVFVPWFVSGTYRWGIPDGDDGRLHCVLNAQTPYFLMFEQDASGEDGQLLGDEALKKQIDLANELAAVNARLYDQELVSHRFLDRSLRRQQTVYADGTVITVDFDQNTYTIKEGTSC